MSKTTRREFLSKTVLGAVGAGVALQAFRPKDLMANSQKGERSYAAAKYGIVLDGATAGWLESVEGGHATSDVVAEKIGAGGARKIQGVKYEDIVLTCGTGMSKGFYDWIKAAFDHQPLRKTGAIVAYDYDYKEQSRTEFTGALISEVTLPALDAASKDAAKMTIKITPEFTRMTTQAKGAPSTMPVARAAQKKWLPSNFKLTINGLDCTRVSKIDAITVKAQAQAQQGFPGLIKGPQSLTDKPRLIVTMPEADEGSLVAWRKVSASGNLAFARKNGELEFLAPDLHEALFAVMFRGLTIANVVPDATAANSENIRRVKAEMSCEEMAFNFSTSAWA
ncbi:MAG TPA: phage tail protein [Candidatus Angelobacter sp.]|nr:phage tail protein [Candidatus Angelobacter sp.]